MLNKIMATVLVTATMVAMCSCSMGLKWSHDGDVQGYTKVAKLNVDEQAK